MYLLYFVIYYYFNMQYYPLFQLKNTKNRKIEKIEFFRAFCVHTQNFFMRKLFDVMLVSKKFFMMF